MYSKRAPKPTLELQSDKPGQARRSQTRAGQAHAMPGHARLSQARPQRKTIQAKPSQATTKNDPSQPNALEAKCHEKNRQVPFQTFLCKDNPTPSPGPSLVVLEFWARGRPRVFVCWTKLEHILILSGLSRFSPSRHPLAKPTA